MTFFTLLLRNLFRRKTRTAFTILGVAVALGTVVLLRGLSEGFEQSMLDNFEKRGVDLVVTAGGVDQLGSKLDEGIGSRITALPNIDRVNGGLLELGDFPRGDGEKPLNRFVHGWEAGGPQFNDLTIISGRKFNADERRVIMLGESLSSALGKTTGDEVIFQDETFQVVGVFRSIAVYESSGAIIPLAELQQLMQLEGWVTGYSVVVARPSEGGEEGHKLRIDATRASILALADPDGKTYKLNATPTKEYVTNSAPIQLAHGFAWVTSLVALLIGAISMLNTMVMSVVERTKEIGILRAIGWRRSRVVRMIMGEAMMLCAAGAVFGTIAAYAAMAVLARNPVTSGFVSGDLPPVVLLHGIGITFVVALIGGLYPAWRASRLDPTEALRHE